MSRLALIRDTRGFTLVELLVATTAGVIVLISLSWLMIVSLRETGRVNGRIDATQRARLVLYQVIDDLHSSCVAAPPVTPVRPGSTGTSLSFIHQRGSAAFLTPVLSTISLSGGTLTETNYAATGGTAPNWTFSSTPTSSRQLMKGVVPTSPSTSIFSYYNYSGGVISSTPLPTPLSSIDAAKTVQVSVGFTVSPGSTQVVDPKAAASIQDTALLRFSPAAFSTSANNLPCQ
jgi:prepilin-type N-terminal cleavage/methylation domain-containing protein